MFDEIIKLSLFCNLDNTSLVVHPFKTIGTPNSMRLIDLVKFFNVWEMYGSMELITYKCLTDNL